ncbi:MAG: carboxypeptidase regulatory-like domain-containing protein [candidate division KSB1 bacterium]
MRHAEDFVVNANATLRHVFVYISSSFGARQFSFPQDSVILDQHGCRYLPHVFGIQVGQPLVLLNSDSTFHNVFAAAKVNRPFNLGMTLSVRKLTRKFDQPEVMVPLRCNVHPWMAAYAGVLAHPFFSVTDADGVFRLGKLPAGEYQITAWHERLGVLQQGVTVGEAESKEVSFKYEIK